MPFFIRMSFQQIVACTLFFVANVISVSNMAYSHSYLAIGGVHWSVDLIEGLNCWNML